MADQPYFRFFASDWLAGTAALSAHEKGVYITLIALMYERQEPIPENRTRLARYCGCQKNTFSRALDALIEQGKILQTEAGLWNKRVQIETSWRTNLCRKSRIGGLKRAESLREKANEINGSPEQPLILGSAQTLPYQNQNHIEVNNSKELLVKPNGSDPPPKSEKMPIQDAFYNYNLAAEELGLPIAEKLTPERTRKLRARLKDHGLEGWNRALEALDNSDFLKGKNDRGWRATLDFMLQPTSLVKLIEGGYADER